MRPFESARKFIFGWKSGNTAEAGWKYHGNASGNIKEIVWLLELVRKSRGNSVELGNIVWNYCGNSMELGNGMEVVWKWHGSDMKIVWKFPGTGHHNNLSNTLYSPTPPGGGA